MTNYRRCRIPGGTYFFTANLANRRQSLLSDHIQPLRDAFREVLTAHRFTIPAIVALPDHIHSLRELPAADSDDSTRWRQIKAAFSRVLPRIERIFASRRSKAERGIWQRRFWEHSICSDAGFATRFDYIHYNPIKHGHLQRLKGWPYSSVHRQVRLGVYSMDWVGDEVQGFDVGEDSMGRASLHASCVFRVMMGFTALYPSRSRIGVGQSVDTRSGYGNSEAHRRQGQFWQCTRHKQ